MGEASNLSAKGFALENVRTWLHFIAIRSIYRLDCCMSIQLLQ